MANGLSKVMVLPDLHCPYEHPDAFHFIKAVHDKYKPDKVILLGDELDLHSASFHSTDHDLPFSVSGELAEAVSHLEQLYTFIKDATIIESNHTSLLYRKAKVHAIPLSTMKSYREILQAPIGWEWTQEYICKFSNGRVALFHHGQSANVLQNSQRRSMSYVQGHFHGQFEIRYWNNGMKQFWAMTTGCLIDTESLAFAYGKNSLVKPILGCAMIIEGHPVLIPMILNKHKRWIGRLI